MALYRKRPIEIEATQWWKDGDHPKVYMSLAGVPVVDTFEGVHIVTPGDFIITGIHNEHYPCKPDIFAKTYDLVAEV